MIKNIIADGMGSGNKVSVKDNGLLVSQMGYPPKIEQKTEVFRQYFTDDGTSTGSNIMKVDGSVTNVDFWIPTHNDNDRYITAVSFLINDGGILLEKFGAVNALANGCVFEYRKEAGEVITIHDSLTTGWDFVRMCMGYPAFGDGDSCFIAGKVLGGSDGVIPVFRFIDVLPPYGLMLAAGTNSRLTLRIRDDCTGVDAFNAIAYGFDRIP